MRTSTLRLLGFAVVMLVLLSGRRTEARSALADSTDIKIRNSSGLDALGSENSVFIHPTDSRIVLVGQNSQSGSEGVNAWVSQDGGKTWSGNNDVIGGPGGRGDPAAVIRRGAGTAPARYLVGQLGHKDAGPALDVGQVVMYKESASGLTWSADTVVTNEGGKTDKNHLWVDNKTGSPGDGNLYAAWSNVDNLYLEAARSTNGGISWEHRLPISAAGDFSEWGVNLLVSTATSTLGNVYAAWGQTVVNASGVSSPSFRVSGLYFTKSTNRGQSWSSPSLIRSLSGRGYAVSQNELLPNTMGATSAPNLATDAAGSLYVVWTQKRISGGDDAEVYILKSTDEGSPWTALGSDPKRVSSTSANDQWHSWITYDDCTDAIVVLYFDSRNDNSKAEAYLSVSYDGGATFSATNEVKISDVAWSGDNGATNDAGEYIGIAARDGIAYPSWSDDRETSGVYKVYVSPIYLWGVTQESIVHTVVSDPEYVLSVRIDWNTNLAALGTDTLILTSPSGFVYTVTATATSPGTSHWLSRTCACEGGWWKYVVKSTRPGFTSRGSDERKFFVVCVD